MSVWTTKALDRSRTYVLIKHKLNDMNGNIHGVKFRAGWAVVEKDSKIYFTLKKLPMIQGGEDYPITLLSKLKFITRTKDILTIFGVDVYNAYMKAMKPIWAEEEKVEHVEVLKRCTHSDSRGKLCYNKAHQDSELGLCALHQHEKDHPPKKVERITREMAKEKKIELRNKLDSKMPKPESKKKGRPSKAKERPKVEPKVYGKPKPTE